MANGDNNGLPYLLWFDAEFSSLDLDRAGLLQVALMATDVNLNRLLPAEEDVNCFIRLDDTVELSEWVKENIPHIVARCYDEDAVELAVAEQRLCDYVQKVTGGQTLQIGQRPLLAGNSVHNDWAICRRRLPQFLEQTHYRLLDVSSLKTLYSGWGGQEEIAKDSLEWLQKYFPGAALEGCAGAHDAYYDIQASAAELGYYKSIINWPL